MENKRSIGVTIFACFFIIDGVFDILRIINHKNISSPIYQTILSLILAFFGFICGIYLLKLKPWARKLVIILATAHIVIAPLFFKMLAPINIAAMRSAIAAKGATEMQQKQFEPVASTVLMMVVAIGIIWNLSIIYFFTRQKVKEQFK